MAFRPNVHDELTLNGVTYRVAEHPAAPGFPCGQEGRAGRRPGADRRPLQPDLEHRGRRRAHLQHGWGIHPGRHSRPGRRRRARRRGLCPAGRLLGERDGLAQRLRADCAPAVIRMGRARAQPFALPVPPKVRLRRGHACPGMSSGKNAPALSA